MTTEQGPGVPDNELLRRLVDVAWATVMREAPMSGIPDELSMQEVVDAILAEIAAAGFEIVASDRLDRLMCSARQNLERIEDTWTPIDGPYPSAIEAACLEPGDLDAVGGGE